MRLIQLFSSRDAGIDAREFSGDHGRHEVVENASRSNRQSHTNTRIDYAPRDRWESFDQGHDGRNSDSHHPRDLHALFGSPPQSHAVQRRQQEIEGVVSLGRPNDQRKTSLDDQRREF